MGQDEEAVRQAYDTVAADYARLIPDTRAEHLLDLAMVEAFVALVGDGPVLDAGCGTGRMSRLLAARGILVEGVDLSPGMLAQARADQPGATFTEASLSDLPFADAHFAGVLAWYSTIHLPDTALGPALAELVRVVRPGGHVLVGFQAGTGSRDLAATYRRLGHEVSLVRHRRTAQEMAASLDRLGTLEVARLVRAAVGTEVDDQAVLLVRVIGQGATTQRGGDACTTAPPGQPTRSSTLTSKPSVPLAQWAQQ